MVVRNPLSIPHLSSCIEVEYDLYICMRLPQMFCIGRSLFLTPTHTHTHTHTDSGIFKSSEKAGEAVDYGMDFPQSLWPGLNFNSLTGSYW